MKELTAREILGRKLAFSSFIQYMPIISMTHRSFSVILLSHIGNLSHVWVNLHRSWPTDRCNWHRLFYTSWSGFKGQLLAIIASVQFYLLVGSISCERSYCLFNPIRLLSCPYSHFWWDPLSVWKIDSLRALIMLILSFDNIETCMNWQLIVSALYLSQPLSSFI